MKRGNLFAGTALGALLWLSIAGLAQRGRFREPDDDETPVAVRNAEFHFIRVEYTDRPSSIAVGVTPRATAWEQAGGWWIGPPPRIISPPAFRG